MSFVFKNNAVSSLAASLSSGATTFNVVATEGALFPAPGGSDLFKIVLENRLTGAREVMNCTSRSGDQFTVTRAQEGTLSQSWPAGTLVSHRVTAAVYTDFVNQDTALGNLITTLTARVTALEAVVEQRKIPVGGLYFSTTTVNPAGLLGYGVWEQYGAGRAFVGDGNNGVYNWTMGETRGAETVTLTSTQMPTHNHGVNDPGHAHGVSDPGHSHSLMGNAGGSIRTLPTQTTRIAGISEPGSFFYREDVIARAASNIGIFGALTGISTQNNGSGQSHNNVQASIAIRAWRRIE